MGNLHLPVPSSHYKSMNIKQQQEYEELCYLKKFLGRMEIEPENIEHGSAFPDFFIRYRSGRIAIEVTEYHSLREGLGGHAWREVEQEWRRIQSLLVEVKKQYSALDDVMGYLFFRDLEMPPTKQHKQFVTELFEFGVSQCESLTEERKWFNSFPANYSLLSKYLKKIWLKRENHSYVKTWEYAHATHVGISEKELEACISEKLTKVRPSEIAENWLLVVSGNAMSQQIGLTHVDEFNDFIQVNNRLKNSCFDKVFFFQYPYQRVLRWSRSGQWEEVKPAHFADLP